VALRLFGKKAFDDGVQRWFVVGVPVVWIRQKSSAYRILVKFKKAVLSIQA
jgi:hypothetical protein